MTGTVGEPRSVEGAGGTQIVLDDVEKLDGLAVHYFARRRSSSERDMREILPPR